MAPRQGAPAKDSFWGSTGEAKGRPAGGGAAAARPAAGDIPAKSEVVDAPPARAEPPQQPRAEQPPVALAPTKEGEEKAEAGAEEDVFEDDDDDLLPEAQPSFPRNEVAKENPKFRQNAVHVYGLDFLKTGHMDEIFSQFNHKFVEWINDSSANIIFADAASAKKALESLSFPKTGDDPWRRTPDILVSEDVPPIFLQMRLAASTDVKPSKRGVPTATPPTHYGSGPRRDSYPDSSRKRMYSDGGGLDAELPSRNNPSQNKPKKARISEEEMLKRKKRALRFGETQPNSGLQKQAAEPEAKAEPAADPAGATAAAAAEAPKPGSSEQDGAEPAGDKPDPAPAS